MTYQAIVCKLTNVRPHPNADRIKLATVQGYQIIVGLEQEDGDLGVFFLGDGRLMKDHLLANKLYSTHPDTGKAMEGYFGKNGRVKTQKFRGEKSEGFWQPIEAFEWTGSTKELIDGYQFDVLNGHRICKKYYTPAAVRAIKERDARKGKAFGKMKIDRSMLHEHYDTKQIRHHIHMIPEGAVLYLTEKVHGTSGRTGHIKTSKPFSRWQKFWIPFVNLVWKATFNNESKIEKYEYVSGTRRVVLNPDQKTDTGYYSGTTFRQDIHKDIEKTGLKRGEILYYEIVGFNNSKAIMPAHNIEDKKLRKRYGEKMQYAYGCDLSECKIYVYRIAYINNEGFEIDLSWPQVVARCKELGLNHVPVLEQPMIHTTEEALLEKLEALADGPSTLDDTHIREGVVVRVEHENMSECLKYKGYHFCELEGIMKNSENYIDPEEVE